MLLLFMQGFPLRWLMETMKNSNCKAFTKNNCEVNIYYPETYNSKTLDVSPEVFYEF